MVFFFWGSSTTYFQIKLSLDGLNLNSVFVIMNELKFFLLTRILTQNSNTVDVAKFLEKKKSEKTRFYGQNKLFS
jgi:hypothetical protein